MPLLERVTFEDLTAFCERFPEGARVEYKREPVHIEKIVASLANTVDGFFVIGVKADDKNMPVLARSGVRSTPLARTGPTHRCGGTRARRTRSTTP